MGCLFGEKVLIWGSAGFYFIYQIKCGNNEEEMVTLKLIPENEDHQLSKKPQFQSCITQFFKNNKK